MTVVVSKSELLHALNVGGAVAGKNKVIPILEMVKCEVSHGKMTVSSHDGECTVSCTIPYMEADETFGFCVSGKDFVGVIKSIKDDSVSITVSVDGGYLLVKHQKGTLQLPITDVASFVMPSQDEAGQHMSMSSMKLAEWIKFAQGFVCQDDLRPVMQGMLLNVSYNHCEMCATDAHKMMVDDYTLEDNNCEFKSVIPARCFQAIMAVLATSDMVSITNHDKNIAFEGDGCMVCCRKVEGNFPNYRAVIPDAMQSVGHATVDKQDIIDSVKRANIFTDMDTHSIKIGVSDGKLHVAGKSEMLNRYVDEFIVAEMGGDIGVALKADFLLNCLSSIVGDKVDILFFGENRAVLFNDGSRGGKTILQMPMATA